MNENVTKVEAKTLYFQTLDGKHVLPASLLKRVGARIIDFFTYSFFGSIFTMIFFSSISTKGPVFSFNQYDLIFMLGIASFLVSTTFFAYIYPIYINKKNIGQSLGKKILNITPMYLKEKYNPKIDILIRESLISGAYLLINIIVLATGFNYISIFNLYQQFLTNTSNATMEITVWKFVSQSKELISTNGFQVTMGYAYIVLSPIFWVVILILTISIAFGYKKRGFHDKMANTAVVDLVTLGVIESYTPTENDISVELEENQKQTSWSLSKWTISNFDFITNDDEKDTSEDEITYELNSNDLINNKITFDSLEKEQSNDFKTIEISDKEIDEKKKDEKL